MKFIWSAERQEQRMPIRRVIKAEYCGNRAQDKKIIMIGVRLDKDLHQKVTAKAQPLGMTANAFFYKLLQENV